MWKICSKHRVMVCKLWTLSLDLPWVRIWKTEFDWSILLKAFYSFDDFKKVFWASFYSKFAGFFSKWWKNYLSKRSLIKRTCSWREVIVLWTLNRQAKIFLRTAYWIIKICWTHHTGGWGENTSKKLLQGQDGKKLFRRTKKVLIKI